MNSEELRKSYDGLVEQIRATVFSRCCSLGTEVPPTDEEGCHFRLPCDITVGEGMMEQKVSEIRAYAGEGWIFITAEWSDEPVDFSDLSVEDMLRIAEGTEP